MSGLHLTIRDDDDLYSKFVQSHIEKSIFASSNLYLKIFNSRDLIWERIRVLELGLYRYIEDEMDKFPEDKLEFPINLEFQHSGHEHDDPEFDANKYYSETKMGLPALSRDLHASINNFNVITRGLGFFADPPAKHRYFSELSKLWDDIVLKVEDLTGSFKKKKNALKKQLESSMTWESSLRQSSSMLLNYYNRSKIGDVRDLYLQTYLIEDKIIETIKNSLDIIENFNNLGPQSMSLNKLSYIKHDGMASPINAVKINRYLSSLNIEYGKGHFAVAETELEKYKNEIWEIIGIFNDVILHGSKSFKQRKANLKKQLENRPTRDVEFISKDRTLAQIRALVNSNAVFDTCKVFEIAYREAKFKFKIKDEDFTGIKLTFKVHDMIVDMYSDLAKKVQSLDVKEFPSINVAHYGAADDDMLATPDGYKRVGLLINNQGLDRSRFDYYVYQSVVNLGDLYWKLGIERYEVLTSDEVQKFEDLKMLIKKTADEFEEWLNKTIAQNNKSYNKKKTELKKQLENIEFPNLVGDRLIRRRILSNLLFESSYFLASQRKKIAGLDNVLLLTSGHAMHDEYVKIRKMEDTMFNSLEEIFMIFDNHAEIAKPYFKNFNAECDNIGSSILSSVKVYRIVIERIKKCVSENPQIPEFREVYDSSRLEDKFWTFYSDFNEIKKKFELSSEGNFSLKKQNLRKNLERYNRIT